MSHADHEWAKEQIAAHLAGGLPADERARLEAHAATCAECIAEIDASRRFDRQMDELFAPVRPKAGLEERVIHAIRTAPPEKSRSTASRLILAAAAVFLMGVLGFVIITIDQGGLSSPLAMELSSRPSAPVAAAPAPKGYWSKLDGAEPSAPEGLSKLRAGVDRNYRGENAAKALESDHMESLDDRVEDRRKDLAGFGGNRGREARQLAAPAAPPATNAPVLALQQQGQDKDTYFRFKDDSPAKPADGRLAEGKALNELAKVEEKQKGGGAGPGQGGERQAQNGLKAMTVAAAGGQAKTPEPQDPEPPKVQRKIIRTGEVEYEIESFDSTLATISKIVEEEGGFVGTVNSDKLPNGKVRGTVVLRCAPEHLDTLLLKLRGIGELKSQNIRSQDVSKQYYDLESRLKAARTMETRLLDIIAKGKGEIKDLLLAEKELGEWRTKIETFEGEKRYYDSQVGLSTLTVTLTEKEIRAPFAVTQTERVNMSLEVEDVEKALKDALAAVADAKGRVTKSDLKQFAAGQYTATLLFEVAPDAAGPLRDRFKQLGTVAKLDVDRIQETEGGSGKAAEVLKVKQKDSQFIVSIYNLANIQPRETVVLSLACLDAEASYKTILARIEKAGGRVVTSSLNRQKNDQTTGSLRFEVKAADAELVLSDIRLAGEVLRLDVSENPDTQNVTKSKRGFQVSLFAMGLVEPRETTSLTLASKNVAESYRKLQEAVIAAGARVTTSQLNENDRQNVTATIGFDSRREQDAKILAALAEAGEVLTRNATRAQDVERVVDSKKRFILSIVNVSTIAPRETYTASIEVDQVDAAVTALEAMVAEAKGRVVDANHNRGADGSNVSRILVDVPLAAGNSTSERLKELGKRRVFSRARNPQAPEGELAIARLEVTFQNPSMLVDADSGPWARIKGGLSVGLTALSWSLTLVVVGLCFVVPVGLVGWVSMKLYRKTKAKAA